MGTGKYQRLMTVAVVLLLQMFSMVNAEERVVKKILCWPAVEPTPEYLIQNLERMKKLPFDGYVLRILDDHDVQIMWEMWGKKPFKLEDCKKTEQLLLKLKDEYEGEIFLRINVTPGNVDWFDDLAWQVVEENICVIAKLAARGKCAGLVFDTEQYVHQPFNYEQQSQKNIYSKEQFGRLIHKRGASLIEKIQSEMAAPKILFTFGYYAAQANVGDGRKGIDYQLLAPFLDGMLSSAKEKTKLIDGWEYSYDYKSREEYLEAERKLKAAIPVVSKLEITEQRLPANYSQAFGIWIDYQQKEPHWEQLEFSKNHYTPQELQITLEHALKQSGEYVWIYSQEPNWFTGEKLPLLYLEGIHEARKKR